MLDVRSLGIVVYLYLKLNKYRRESKNKSHLVAPFSPSKAGDSPRGQKSTDLESMKVIVLDYLDKVFPPVYDTNR